MAKQKTRAELKADNNAQRDKKIEELNEIIERERSDHEHVLKNLSLALESHRVPTLDRAVAPVNVSSMFFRVGELVTAEREYKELKDRTLPLEKSKVLEKEDRHHGNPGIGNIGVGRV